MAVDPATVSADKPEAFGMPGAANLAKLTIRPTGEAVSANLYYGGAYNAKNDTFGAVNKITLTTPTTIENINFIDRERTKAEEKAGGANVYRGALALAMGGKDLTLKGVTFDGRGLTIDGGKTGKLTLSGNKALRAGRETGSFTDNGSTIEGAITNLNELILTDGKSLDVRDYGTAFNAAGEATKTAAGNLSVTNLAGKNNSITVSGNLTGTQTDLDSSPLQIGGAFSATNLTVKGSTVDAKKAVNITNITTDGGTDYSVIYAGTDFNVTGSINAGGSNLALIGRQKAAKAGTLSGNIAPYLNIKGAVNTADSAKIAVGIRPNTGDGIIIPTSAYNLQMLTTAKGKSEQFAPVISISGNTVTTSEFEPGASGSARGIALYKTGSVIYAYDGANIKTALVKADAGSEPDLSSLEEGMELLGYFPDFNTAVAEINNRNTKANSYVIALMEDIGSNSAPVAINMPKATALSALGIYSPTEKGIYYNKSIAFTTDAVVNKVNLEFAVNNLDITAPKGTKLTIKDTALSTGRNFGAYDLILDGNGSVYAGVTTVGTTTVTDKLSMSDGTVLSGRGMITLASVENAGGTIRYVRINKGKNNEAAGLKITGSVNNSGDQLKLVLTDGTGAADNRVTIPAGFNKAPNYSSLFTGSKQLLNAPRVTANDVEIYAGDIAEENKLNENPASVNDDTGLLLRNGDIFYYADRDLLGNAAGLTIGEDDKAKAVFYIDLNKALSQVTAYGDKDKAYTVYAGVGGREIRDTNITDNNKHSNISLPGNNQAASLIIKPYADGNAELYYSGNIVGYAKTGGKLELEKLVLRPVNPGNDNPTENSNITLYRNGTDKTGTVTLRMNNAMVSGGGYLNQINGTKGVTEVILDK
ncbi:MAG: hypothetical protein K6E33_03695, partial [Lachnospiraceae bacterium]|nr:hypothetical protein [Lachnospiraceae bacterium]